MRSKKYIDLTFPIHKKMLTFPSHWHPRVEIIKMGQHKTEGRETRKIVIGTHTGTHVDAPCHFIPNGASIEQVPLDICIGPAILVFFGNKKVISADDLEERLKNFKNLERLIVRFDWSERWGNLSYYKDYPYFSEEACCWLIEKGVKLLGMDTPSPDDPRNNRKATMDSPNHKLFLKSGIVLLEYLCNLKKLNGPNIFLIALPLKIEGADGSPARVIAYDI